MPTAGKPISLGQLAALLGRDAEGDVDRMIGGVASLETAGDGDLAFARSPSFADAVARSQAGALILPEGVDAGSRPCIRSTNPALDFARAVDRLVPSPQPSPGIAPGAWVSPDAQIDESAAIAPGVVVGAGVRIGARSVLRANVSIYDDVSIGSDCELHAGVTVREGTSVGDRVVLQPGVVLGADGFGIIAGPDGSLRRVPHVGRVVIEDDVEIGANSTVDRATLGETRIRRGAKIDNLVQISHNCDVGANAIVVAQSGLSGSTRVGAGAVLMAQSGSAGHLRIGEGAFVAARAGLHKDVAPGARVYGAPALEEKRWHRSVAALARLPELMRRLRRVERVLGLRGRSKADAEQAAPEGGEGES